MRINSLSPVNSNYPTNHYSNVQSNNGTDAPQKQTETADASVKEATNINAPLHLPEKESDERISEELLDRSIQQANKNLAYQNRVIERAVHDVTKAVMYTVKDTVTHEVIAEFPPKRIQDMIAKMWELAGLFVDEKA